MYRILAILILSTVLSACGAKTTVILLPDESGTSSGAVVVQTEKGSQVVDKPYTATTVSSLSSLPSPPTVTSRENVDKEFKALISAEPLKPVSYTLYFVTGSTTLTSASKERIPSILEEAQKRAPSEISIIGHTDSTGSAELNLKLSSKRANAVETLLRQAGADMKRVYISYHGESDPLIPTEDNVAEPKNRRVEILIR